MSCSFHLFQAFEELFSVALKTPQQAIPQLIPNSVEFSVCHCVYFLLCHYIFIYIFFCVLLFVHLHMRGQRTTVLCFLYFLGFMCTITTSTCFCFCKAWHAHPCQWDTALLGSSGRVVNSLDFCLALLKSLGCFTSGKWDFLHSGRQWQWICEFYTTSYKVIFGGP